MQFFYRYRWMNVDRLDKVNMGSYHKGPYQVYIPGAGRATANIIAEARSKHLFHFTYIVSNPRKRLQILMQKKCSMRER